MKQGMKKSRDASIIAILLVYLSPPILAFPIIDTNISYGPWEFFTEFSGCQTGDHVNGLAKMKKYFQHFGYISETFDGVFGDDFDPTLENAIKTYQLNFNLNITGILDEETLGHIVRPRCGVADIINGTNWMNSGEKAENSTGLFHEVAHYSFFPGNPRWKSKSTLTYAFSPNSQVPVLDAARTVFSRSFLRWSEVIPLTFVEINSYFDADIKIYFAKGDHGDGEPFDGKMGTLAHAFSPENGRFHLDADEDWVIDGDVRTSSLDSPIDLESVAVHEIGHLLGLTHSSIKDSIMYPSITTRLKKVVLANDDIQGIQRLYGSNPNWNPAPTTSPPQENQLKNSGGSSLHQALPCFFSLLTAMAGFLILVNFK